MNQLKRTWSDTSLSEDRTEKLPKLSDETKFVNSFENLSNEIIYEIFDYLDGCDIYRSFVGLNARFRQILINLHIPLKFNLRNITSSSLPTFEKLVLALRKRIISLNFSQYVRPLKEMILNSSFLRLESLTFHLNYYKKTDYLSSFSTLPCLYSLTIYLSDHSQLDQVYSNIFSLPKLKYAKISCDDSSTHNTLMTMSSHDQLNSSLERLIIDHDCTLSMLYGYLFYTPRLLRLICKRKVIQSDINHLLKLSHQPILTHISIQECSSDFDSLKVFIKEISSQLQVLRLSTVDHCTYFDAERWERLISQHILRLSKLEMKSKEFLDKNFRLSSYHRLMHRFASAFWLERQWILHYKVAAGGRKKGVITYSLTSYKSSPTDPFIHRNTFSPNQLTIAHLVSLKWTRLFINNIKPVLNLFNITRLIFANHGVSIRTLFELLRMLNHLNSLVISSFIPLEIKKPINISKNILTNSKITQVYLSQLNTIEDIIFLLNLCPQINYLEIDQITQKHFQDLIQLFQVQSHVRDLLWSLRNFQLNGQIIQQLNSHHCSFTYSSNNLCVQNKKNID